jgi:hypothetical protein
VTFGHKEDPFGMSLDDLKKTNAINVTSAFVAAQQATQGFKELPESAARTFIVTGNILNTVILPGFMDQGMGKSASAHMIWAASDAYKDNGFK